MLKLCGFPVSNYFNKVRLVLEERGIPHEIDPGCFPSQADEFLSRSPMGRIPFLETEHGILVESTVIAEYLEDTIAEKPLLPKEPFARAQVRSLLQTLELNVELIARRLYSEAFFGGKISEDTKKEVAEQLEKGVRAFKSMAKFAPYLAGSELTIADCGAIFHLPVISGATQIIYGKDVLAGIPQLGAYLKLMSDRPAMAKIMGDREKALEYIAKVRKERAAKAQEQAQSQGQTQAPAANSTANQNQN